MMLIHYHRTDSQQHFTPPCKSAEDHQSASTDTGLQENLREQGRLETGTLQTRGLCTICTQAAYILSSVPGPRFDVVFTWLT